MLDYDAPMLLPPEAEASWEGAGSEVADPNASAVRPVGPPGWEQEQRQERQRRDAELSADSRAMPMLGPVPQEGRLIQFAGRPIGPSHVLAFRGAYCWCWNCGGYGLAVPRMLKSTCKEAPATKAQRDILSRLGRGRLPTLEREWDAAHLSAKASASSQPLDCCVQRMLSAVCCTVRLLELVQLMERGRRSR